jgi:hypothetical protein
MTAFTRNDRRVVPWHVPALLFFAAGLLGSASLCVTAPVAGIRALGAIALVSSAVGLGIVAYTLRIEDPRQWALITRRMRTWLASVSSHWRAVWARRNAFVRYLQGAVWSGECADRVDHARGSGAIPGREAMLRH